MNDTDSKKLEEVDDLQHYMEATSRLSAKVKEQDREIERWKGWSDEKGAILQKAINIAVKRAEKAEAELKKARTEIERLNSDLTQMNLDSMEEELRLNAELSARKERIKEPEEGLGAIRETNCFYCYGADLAESLLAEKKKE